jgi:hypothetical protein
MFAGILPAIELAEATWVHLVPLALVLLLGIQPWRRWSPLLWATAAVALVCSAPFLPFGWEQTSWRLILLGFVGAGIFAGFLAARFGWLVPALVGLVGTLTLPGSAADQARREPDYALWAQYLPVLQATVPAGERVIAHRGLCGFVWAEGGRICENFQPPSPHEGWWRIVYGMGAQRLSPYSPSPVPLAPAYTLVPESDYQEFRADHVGKFRLLSTDLNPWTPRPPYVYGPGGATPYQTGAQAPGTRR